MLYFLKNNDKVKIGYSHKPVARISTIQTSNPDPIECLLLIDGGYEDESRLHSMFYKDKLRCNGEWFSLSDDILMFIKNNISGDRRYEYNLIPSEYKGNQQIKRIREEEGLTLKDLSKIAEMSPAGIKETESREKKGNITINKMRKIASALSYKFEYRIIKKDTN